VANGAPALTQQAPLHLDESTLRLRALRQTVQCHLSANLELANLETQSSAQLKQENSPQETNRRSSN